MESSSTSSTSTGGPAVPIMPVAVGDPPPPDSGFSSSDIEAIADVMLRKLKEKGSAEASTAGTSGEEKSSPKEEERTTSKDDHSCRRRPTSHILKNRPIDREGRLH